LYHWVIWCAGTSALTKSAATFFNISWSSVKLKSIVFSCGWNDWNLWNDWNEKLPHVPNVPRVPIVPTVFHDV
jgi:hypothetical protein